MSKIGRPRSRVIKCPSHIDASKLPDHCYWDSSGRGHWYTSYKDEAGKRRRRKIAGPTATLSDLHKIIEEKMGISTDNIAWLAEKFEKSTQFDDVSVAMKKDWRYCKKVVCEYPSRKPGLLMGQVPLAAWNPPLVQKLIDGIASARGPSSAKHVYSYLKRLFNWGLNRHYCLSNPVQKTELPKERKLRRLPTPELLARVMTFAQSAGNKKGNEPGSCPYYIWIALELAYLCRLRGVEVFALTDASIVEQGVVCQRTKGSSANIAKWNNRLRSCVAVAQEKRQVLFNRLGRPTQLRPENRPLLVNGSGAAINQSSWQSAWRRFTDLAIREGIITEEEKFGLHDMKRRGATDTKGTKSVKMEATGHSSLQMLKVYDMSIPLVDPSSE